MQAVVVNLRLNSLYSIRVPFTWQSSLTYPVLPPSAVIGMFANAIQRYKDGKHPREYLKELEFQIIWAGSRLLGPSVIKSYITSAITKWEDRLGGKFTNALGRQFAYTRLLQCIAVFKNKAPEEIVQALISVPLTCGDSESAASVEEKPKIKEVRKEVLSKPEEVDTNFHVPLGMEGIEGMGRVYLMHERCQKGKEFPLNAYICPVKEEEGILMPSKLKIRCPQGSVVIEIKDLGTVILKKGN